MKKIVFFFSLISTLNLSAQVKYSFPESLLLTPEKLNFEKTSSYNDVIQFLDNIKKLSSNIFISTIGRSTLGKEIPYVVLSNPLITNPTEAKASNKTVVYVQANIHAGEVEGKEASMMLMRDILLGDKKYLLKNLIIIFVPIYNTDGNDMMANGLRPSQENSPIETGIRENGQGLDLNRDGIKMEAPETIGMIKNILTDWDPQMVLDLHTTNGTWHGYSLTWAPGYLSSGDANIYNYNRDTILPFITKQLLEKNDLFIGPYGDFDPSDSWPPKSFYTYNHHPRYIINQIGLRNRMSILSETFAHERFYQRINSTYHFVSEVLEYCNNNSKTINRITKEADENAIQNVVLNSGKIKKGVRFKMVPEPKQLNHFRTYDYTYFTNEKGDSQLVKTANIVHYDSIKYFAKFEATLTSTLPKGYIIPAAFANIAAHLIAQGIKVNKIEKKIIYTGEVFVFENLNKAKRKFEGHFMAKADGFFKPSTYKAKEGDYFVDMAQPLTNLIFYTLEPQSDDGLLVWNFFDDYLESKNVNLQKAEYPIFKIF